MSTVLNLGVIVHCTSSRYLNSILIILQFYWMNITKIGSNTVLTSSQSLFLPNTQTHPHTMPMWSNIGGEGNSFFSGKYEILNVSLHLAGRLAPSIC